MYIKSKNGEKGKFMFRRFFGETEEIQMGFLKKRVIISLVLTVIFLLAGFVDPVLMPVGVSLSLYIWGWPSAKILFGISSYASLFSTNFLFAVLLFAISLMIIPVIGIVFMIVGVLRFIYLLVKKAGKNA